MEEQTPPPNPLATASVVLGALSCLTACFCCYGFPFNLIGLVLGIVAITQINADPTQGGKKLAQIGIGLSVFSVVMVIGLVVLSMFLGVGFGLLGAVLDNM
jgi:hypothetical protein